MPSPDQPRGQGPAAIVQAGAGPEFPWPPAPAQAGGPESLSRETRAFIAAANRWSDRASIVLIVAALLWFVVPCLGASLADNAPLPSIYGEAP